MLRLIGNRKETLKASFALFFLVFMTWTGLQESEATSTSDQEHPTFCCAVNCMDGRVQDPVANFMRKFCSAKYVDMINEAGVNKTLADNPDSGIAKYLVINIKEEIKISQKHGAKIVAIVGHYECGGNPAGKEEQIEHLRKAKETVEAFGLNIQVILLWVEKDFKTVVLIK